MMPKSREHDHLRRQALALVSQLPDNTAEALLVLDHMRDLVLRFLDEPEVVSSASVTAFPASVSSR